MASLAELYGTAKAKARQIPANLRESGKGLASWAVDPYGEAQRVMGEYRNMTPEQRQGLVNAAVDLFGGIDVGPVGAIKASHGSPHAFTAFDFSKMGTGEGAQAYGHGGYFAQGFDSPVAKQYAEGVGDKTNVYKINGEYVDIDKLPNFEALAIKSMVGPYKLSQKEIFNRLRSGGAEEANINIVKDALKKYKGLVTFGPKDTNNLYNVELRWPDPAREAADPLSEHHLLDWDAPMTKQTPEIQKAWLATKKDLPPNAMEDLGDDLSLLYGKDITPDDFLGTMASIGGNYGFGESLLRKAGIPGIRYLDQASRGQGAGTRNYVIFDDKFPNIVTRNGVSITDLLKNR